MPTMRKPRRPSHIVERRGERNPDGSLGCITMYECNWLFYKFYFREWQGAVVLQIDHFDYGVNSLGGPKGNDHWMIHRGEDVEDAEENTPEIPYSEKDTLSLWRYVLAYLSENIHTGTREDSDGWELHESDWLRRSIAKHESQQQERKQTS